MIISTDNSKIRNGINFKFHQKEKLDTNYRIHMHSSQGSDKKEKNRAKKEKIK
jgi:hypothetical protein